ncbi:uncharacterized protein [Spinacia oleracea]|uniref:CCHC-type domain-containing protein n=1 Tax=Spinacia oleracea TaxID=3562 RepID=A0ABM3QZ07_SPIOL|nr:uncharacterized protein LOC130463442 [Spinacia oleracea]
MAEEIAQICSKLSIEDVGGDIIDLGAITADEEDEKLTLMLVGRLLTERSYNVEDFKRTMMSVWSPAHGMVIRVLSPNLYAFQFFHWRDKERVLEGRPWCFDNMLILLKEMDGDEQPEKVTITHSPFWVRVKNLPFNCRSDAYVRALAGGMGEVIKLEEDSLGVGRYRRVKIMLNTRLPLKQEQRIKDKKGREVKVEYVYERLPYFCFACGVMGHSERECHAVLEEDKKKKLGWGPGLKATPRKGRAKEVEEIESIVSAKKALFVTKGSGDKEKGETVEKETSNNTSVEALLEGRIEKGKHEEKTKAKLLTLTVSENIPPGTNKPNEVEIPQEDSTGTFEQVNQTTTLSFVMGTTGGKEKKGGGRSWKRQARDTGRVQQVGHTTTGMQKRNLENVDMEIENDDGFGKRAKQGSLSEVLLTNPAEVGADQPATPNESFMLELSGYGQSPISSPAP